MAANYTAEQLLKLGEPSAEMQEASALSMPHPHVVS